MEFRFRTINTIVLALALTTAMALPAAAQRTQPSDTTPEPVVTGLAGPLHISFGSTGRLYIADAFAGEILQADLRRASKHVVVSGLGFAPGVDVQGSKVYFIASQEPAGPNDQGSAELRLAQRGHVTRVADLLAFEVANNPDQQPQVPGDALSNPYDVLVLPNRRVLVADAGANDIIEVSRDGVVKTLTPLPVIREGECATETNNGVPNGGCDPVPTAMAWGPDGYLYASGLGGEKAGRIWKIDVDTGEIVHTYTGLPPLTGVEVDRAGNVYASSLFAGKIFRITPSGEQTAATVPGPTGLALHRGRLYAGSVSTDENAPPAGQVFRVPLGAFK